MSRTGMVSLVLGSALTLAGPAAVGADTQGGIAAEEPVPTAPGPEAGIRRGEVLRSGFTSGIDGREPVDRILSLSTEERKVYYFTELQGMSGQSVRHRWQHEGRLMAEVVFQVGGSRWRVWSSKNLIPAWTGQWRVQVVTEDGRVLREETFEYKPAGQAR